MDNLPGLNIILSGFQDFKVRFRYYCYPSILNKYDSPTYNLHFMKSFRLILLLFITVAGIIILFTACENLEVNRVIKIETLSVSDSASNSTASVLGEIIDLDEDGIIEHGHCWSTKENPTIVDSNTRLGPANKRGEYSSSMVALVPFASYFVRAYVTDKRGTTYGNQVEFIKSVFTDSRDGRKYKWVSIGDQVWMAENLAWLPVVSPFLEGSRYNEYYYVFGYNGSDVTAAKATNNYAVYGVLYNWMAAMNSAASSDNNPGGVQGVCPDGWHMPGDAEWKQLEMALGMSAEEVGSEEFRGTDEGGKLKESGNTHWIEPNEGADNSAGFTALPGGWREDPGNFWSLGETGCWWSTTEYDDATAYKRALSYDEARIERNNYFKECAFSVRCLRDN
jgi:uncharacterized protein (TIGR02145 family)